MNDTQENAFEIYNEENINKYINDTEKLYNEYEKYKKISILENLENRLDILKNKKLTNMQNIKYKKLNEKINKYLQPIKQKRLNRNLKKHQEEIININRFLELAGSNKKIIDNKNIHEIRDSLGNINKEFELNGNLTINGQIKKTNMRFKNIDAFDKYIEKIDMKYDSEDVLFEGDSYIIEKDEFNKVNRSDYGKGSNHLYDIQEYIGKNCYIPTGQNCFLKCINYLTGKDYKNEYFQFINSEGRRKTV